MELLPAMPAQDCMSPCTCASGPPISEWPIGNRVYLAYYWLTWMYTPLTSMTHRAMQIYNMSWTWCWTCISEVQLWSTTGEHSIFTDDKTFKWRSVRKALLPAFSTTSIRFVSEYLTIGQLAYLRFHVVQEVTLGKAQYIETAQDKILY